MQIQNVTKWFVQVKLVSNCWCSAKTKTQKSRKLHAVAGGQSRNLKQNAGNVNCHIEEDHVVQQKVNNVTTARLSIDFRKYHWRINYIVLTKLPFSRTIFDQRHKKGEILAWTTSEYFDLFSDMSFTWKCYQKFSTLNIWFILPCPRLIQRK